eukprot:TRINITY_DN4419_c0_g1_i1.p1 TRINITY_DN4419_c0_g1~~TRINITY_DN4419_c0_g1_i1.p1  ORF type:complete len:388 (+),score=85.70 TRINITY_DN4419_c0_g1_i1:406-1569(+)
MSEAAIEPKPEMASPSAHVLSSPRDSSDIFQSLEQFCNSKNLPVAKYKNLLRSSSSSINQLSTPTTPTSSGTASTPGGSPSSSLVWTPTSAATPSTPLSVSDVQRFALASLTSSSNGSLNLAANLQNLRFSFASLSGTGSGSFNLSSSSLGKRPSDDEEEDRHGPSKRSKKNNSSNLNIKMKVGLSYHQCISGGTKQIQYHCQSLCSRCTDPKERQRCAACSGTGRLLLPRALELEIPKGLKRGVKKTFKGRGHVGEDTNTVGDLIVEFDMEDHPFYKRNGDNASCQVSVTIVQAVLGTRVFVPKLYGEEKEKLEVKIEAGVQPNDVIRLPGEGFFKPNCKKKRGDLELSVKVEVPKNITKEQREMFEKLSLIENILSLSAIAEECK